MYTRSRAKRSPSSQLSWSLNSVMLVEQSSRRRWTSTSANGRTSQTTSRNMCGKRLRGGWHTHRAPMKSQSRVRVEYMYVQNPIANLGGNSAISTSRRGKKFHHTRTVGTVCPSTYQRRICGQWWEVLSSGEEEHVPPQLRPYSICCKGKKWQAEERTVAEAEQPMEYESLNKRTRDFFKGHKPKKLEEGKAKFNQSRGPKKQRRRF